jgi:hypothetical protein
LAILGRDDRALRAGNDALLIALEKSEGHDAPAQSILPD